MKKDIKILYVSAEVAPFSKAGGLADVAGSLPSVLKKTGLDVRVITARYQTTNLPKGKWIYNGHARLGDDFFAFGVYEAKTYEDTPIYFIGNEFFFENRDKVYSYDDDIARFYFFSLAILDFIKNSEWKPDIIHLNDWHGGIISYLLKKDKIIKKLKIKSLFTIHNLSFQGAGVLLGKKINLARLAIKWADLISTVSPNYAREILTAVGGSGLHRQLLKRKKNLYGILNGIDYYVFDPLKDPQIPFRFDESSLDDKLKNKIALQQSFDLPENPAIPILGIASRITNQKGLGLLISIIDWLLALELQIVIVGGGDPNLVKKLKVIIAKYPKKVAGHLEFNVEIASLIYAGSDMFLMPSLFEPCGLGQLIAMRYGSVPIVRRTGGLADTIKDYDTKKKTGNGFVFESFNSVDFFGAIVRALTLYRDEVSWRELLQKIMQERFSWDESAEKYIKLYNKLIK